MRQKERTEKRFEPEGPEKYKEVNNNIKGCMKMAEENWIGEQCSEIEEILRKNNSTKGIPTRERLDHCETRKSYYCPRSFRKNASQKNERYGTDGQYWTVP